MHLYHCFSMVHASEACIQNIASKYEGDQIIGNVVARLATVSCREIVDGCDEPWYSSGYELSLECVEPVIDPCHYANYLYCTSLAVKWSKFPARMCFFRLYLFWSSVSFRRYKRARTRNLNVLLIKCMLLSAPLAESE